jgi:hypothetical protein
MAKGSTVKTKTVAAERPVARTGRTASAQPITATAQNTVVATRKPDVQAVAQRAYEIFEREGRPHGRDVEHWLRAEAELSSGASA